VLTLILQSGATDDNLVGQIRESAKHFEGQASRHRLNQNEPKGPQTLRAAKVKENETALKQQRKAEIFKMEASIVIYPVGSAVCKKVSIRVRHHNNQIHVFVGGYDADSEKGSRHRTC
jgi:hypothetical protein